MTEISEITEVEATTTTTATTPPKGLRGTKEQAKILVLLGLWYLGGVNTEVNKTELTGYVLRENERVGDFKEVFEELAADEFVIITEEKVTKETKEGKKATNKVIIVTLTDKGFDLLQAGLKDPDFYFDGIKLKARDKDVNTLLKWIREMTK